MTWSLGGRRGGRGDNKRESLREGESLRGGNEERKREEDGVSGLWRQ
jgi:hypothetical protein